MPEADRLTVEHSFGPGVLGDAVRAPVLGEPELYAGPRSGSRSYRRVGEDSGEMFEPMQWSALGIRDGAPVWRYAAGRDEAGYIALQPDGSLVLTGVEDAREGALTRYDPSEPYLLKGLAPGQEREVRMAVQVYDLKRPSELMHRGSLKVVYRYVGAYRLRVPAGTYEAILLKSTFSGTIGPASLEDTQYRFFAPHAGLVATIEHRDVSAFLLYNAHTRAGKLLSE
jgi:hypothetical protein